MKKNKGIYIFTGIISVVCALLGVALFKLWWLPTNKEKDLKDSIKDISNETANALIANTIEQKENDEGDEATEKVETVVSNQNNMINDTYWINYNDKSVITFYNGYFVWYSDTEMSEDNCKVGEYVFYQGEEAFNSITSVSNNEELLEQSNENAMLILNTLSNKENGEETLESEETTIFMGYYKVETMSFVDISTYDEYIFLKVDASEESTNSAEATATPVTDTELENN